MRTSRRTIANPVPMPIRAWSDKYGNASIDRPRALSEDMNSDEENRDYFEQKMKKYEECINTPWDTPIPVAIERDTRGQERKEIKKDRVITSTDIEQDKDKEDEYLWKP